MLEYIKELVSKLKNSNNKDDINEIEDELLNLLYKLDLSSLEEEQLTDLLQCLINLSNGKFEVFIEKIKQSLREKGLKEVKILVSSIKYVKMKPEFKTEEKLIKL